MMIEPIETEHLLIRDVRTTDFEAFYDYMKREDYWRNLPMEPPTPDWVRSLIERSIRAQTAAPRISYFLAALSKETRGVIGEAILQIDSIWHGRGEIGWGVDRRYTGRGLGTEIGRAMLQLGFSLGLHRIAAQCRVGNIPSLRIMAKLGMIEEGIIRENVKARGERWSSSQWSILRNESR